MAAQSTAEEKLHHFKMSITENPFVRASATIHTTVARARPAPKMNTVCENC